MLDFFGELFMEVVVRLLFVYPGAFIWWLCSGCKETPDQVVKKRDWLLLSIIGMLATATGIFIAVQLG